VLVIGGVVAILAAVGTQATFTDPQQATGDVNAGGLNLYVSDITGTDDNGDNEFIFNAAAENLQPGGSTTWTVLLRNIGTLPLDIPTAISTAGSTNLDCDGGGPDFTVTAVSSGDNGVDNHGAFIHIAPEATAGPIGGTENVTVTVSLSSLAGDACQNAIANIVVDFAAAQH
jgi:hypothetical protein